MAEIDHQEAGAQPPIPPEPPGDTPDQAAPPPNHVAPPPEGSTTLQSSSTEVLNRETHVFDDEPGLFVQSAPGKGEIPKFPSVVPGHRASAFTFGGYHSLLPTCHFPRKSAAKVVADGHSEVCVVILPYAQFGLERSEACVRLAQ